MRKVFALLLVLVPLFITACATSGGSFVGPKDRTESLMEALAESPTGGVEEEKAEIVLPTPETVRQETEEVEIPEAIEEPEAPVVQTEETAPLAPEEVPAAPETVDTPSPEVSESEEIASEEEPVVIPLPPVEEEGTAVIEPPAEPDDSDGDVIPVSGNAEETPSRIFPAGSQSSQSRNIMDEPMHPWMIRLMVILVVVMILFTAAAAIRNAYKAPLNRLVSLAIAVLLTALSWILSYIIAGPSPLYFIYLVLLFTYIILRSTGRSHNV